MKKIPSLFERDWQADEQGSRKVIDKVGVGVEWVIAGEGVATRKWDGIAVLMRQGAAFKRYDAKSGRSTPVDFEPAQPEPDPKSGHWPGWVPAKLPDDKWLLEGVEWGRKNLYAGSAVPDGTYEVCGPRIGTRHGANPENLSDHILVPHGRHVVENCPTGYGELRDFLSTLQIEGIVWHHPDGRMCKIKKNDFPPRVSPALKSPKP